MAKKATSPIEHERKKAVKREWYQQDKDRILAQQKISRLEKKKAEGMLTKEQRQKLNELKAEYARKYPDKKLIIMSQKNKEPRRKKTEEEKRIARQMWYINNKETHKANTTRNAQLRREAAEKAFLKAFAEKYE